MDAAVARPAGRRRRAWMAVGVLLVGVVALGWWYRGSATAFDVSVVADAGVDATHAGTPYSVGVTGGELPAVTVTDARVLVTDGSGPAALGASVCETGSVGAAAGPLSSYSIGCTDLSGADLGDLTDSAQIVVTVVPLGTDSVEVTGLSLQFRDGWRTGSQVLPVHLTVAAPT